MTTHWRESRFGRVQPKNGQRCMSTLYVSACVSTAERPALARSKAPSTLSSNAYNQKRLYQGVNRAVYTAALGDMRWTQ